MPRIAVSARTGPAAETDADTRVVGVFEGEQAAEPELQAMVESGEAKAALRKVAVAHAGGKRVILAGLGKRDELDPERARVAAAVAAGRARELGARALSWAAPSDDAGVVGGVVEGTLLALYSFDSFKSSKDEDAGVESLEVASDGDLAAAVDHARVVAEAQNAARDLQNTPANVATPTFLAERAQELASAHEKLSVEVWDRERIASEGMGAFAAVAQGTHVEPRLIVLRYEGGGSGPLLGYVGKAVTFDTGGISIKPSAKMHEMKFDMSGGAAVLEGIGANAQLDLPARVLGAIGSTGKKPSRGPGKPRGNRPG